MKIHNEKTGKSSIIIEGGKASLIKIASIIGAILLIGKLAIGINRINVGIDEVKADVTKVKEEVKIEVREVKDEIKLVKDTLTIYGANIRKVQRESSATVDVLVKSISKSPYITKEDAVDLFNILQEREQKKNNQITQYMVMPML